MNPGNLRPTIVNDSLMREVLADVRANRVKLQECKRPHDFEVVDDDCRKGWKKQKCKKCGGALSHIEATIYKEGLEDGKRR